MNPGVIGQIGQQVRSVAQRMRHAFHWAKTSAPANESGGTQIVQVTNFQGEVVRDVRSVQHYGFASSPIVGCDVFMLNGNGDTGAGYAIASNDPRYRPKNMPPGAARLYAVVAYVHVEGDKVTISAPGNVTVNAPKLLVNGDIEATGDVRAGSVSLKQHRHPETGSVTQPPQQ